MQHRSILLASPHENTIELIIAVLSHQQFYIPIPSVQEGLIKHRLNKKKKPPLLTFHLIYATVKIKIHIKNLHYKNNLVKELHFPTIKKSDDD